MSSNTEGGEVAPETAARVCSPAGGRRAESVRSGAYIPARANIQKPSVFPCEASVEEVWVRKQSWGLILLPLIAPRGKRRSAAPGFAPTASKRPALNFIVSVRRDYFVRTEQSRPIQARELGFPDQPLTGRAGSEREIEERTSSPHLLRMSPLSLLLHPFFPFLVFSQSLLSSVSNSVGAHNLHIYQLML